MSEWEMLPTAEEAHAAYVAAQTEVHSSEWDIAMRVEARARRNLYCRRFAPEVVCDCGHPFLNHDPEDGRCDSRDLVALDVCWCGRREQP